MRKLYATFILASTMYCAHAQYSTLGTAVALTPNVHYQLTPVAPQIEKAGAVWATTQVSLLSDWSLNAQLNFGSYNDVNRDLNAPVNTYPGAPANIFQTGADGIAFVLAPAPYLGERGEEIGYGTTTSPGGVYTPNFSLAVEMDTWQNIAAPYGYRNHNDPAPDHVAIMTKGQSIHGTPTQYGSTLSVGELEDGLWHDVVITWVAATRTLTLSSTSAPVFSVSQSFTQAQLDAIFGVGVTMVNWGFTAGTGSATNAHQVRFPVDEDCGQLRTQTQGGWGSEPHGNNPGAYLADHFAAAFPSGVTVGLAGAGTNYSATWTTAAAIAAYLPAGGPSAKLTQDYTNATTSQLKNNAVAQVLALSISVGLDAYYDDFGAGGVELGDMIIGSGPFDGWTVDAFLAEANKVLGGGVSSYSVAQIQSTAGAINENYVDGTMDNGYLECPPGTERSVPGRNISEQIISQQNGMVVYPNPSRGQVQLNLGTTSNSQIMIVNARGAIVERRSAGGAQTLSFDLKKYGTGVYLIKVGSGANVQTSKVIVQD